MENAQRNQLTWSAVAGRCVRSPLLAALPGGTRAVRDSVAHVHRSRCSALPVYVIEVFVVSGLSTLE